MGKRLVELQHRTDGRKVLGYVGDDTVRFEDGREVDFKYWAVNERFDLSDVLAAFAEAVALIGAVCLAAVTWGGE